MASACCQNPFKINGHFQGKSKFIMCPKVGFSNFDFPSIVEYSKLNLYPCLPSTSASRQNAGRVHSLSHVDASATKKMPTPILDMIENPMNLKNLTLKELKQLADDIRSELLFIMSRTQNSFRASLSVVELTIAIHCVFHAPLDKIVWDIGDQTYPHKFLTGRRPLVHQIEQQDDPSSHICRSKFDPFGVGSWISSGLGVNQSGDNMD